MGPAALALLYGTAAVVVLTGACRAPAPCLAGLACEAACPRDSTVDASGRCACGSGDLPVLGACVPPAVADEYCGRAERASADGCAFVECDADEAVDSDSGCVPVASLEHGGASACQPGTSVVVASGRTACVAPDVACPRGSRAQGAACVRPPRCPAGTLGLDGACRPIVVRRHAGIPVVDVGAWASIVLGVDGGPGAPDLCRPLQGHPAALGVVQGESLVVGVHVALTVPDEDLTRVVAEVEVHGRPGTSAESEVRAHVEGRSLPPSAGAVAEAAVAGLVEPLRGLGGEALATRTAGSFRCTITSL
jgi:hypothetical protein